MRYFKTRKLETEGTPPAIIVTKHRVTIAFLCLQRLFLWPSDETIFVKQFSLDIIKSEFANKEKLNFNDSLCQAIFEIFQIRTKYARLERMAPLLPSLKHLPSIDTSLVPINKLSSNEKEKHFLKDWKECKLFEINAQQDS